MSHDPDESGAVPDDRLYARPYTTPAAGGPSRPSTPAWPHTGPVSHPYAYTYSYQDGDAEPDGEPAFVPPRAAVPGRAAAGAAGAGHRRERRGADPLTLAVLTLVGLAATGGLVLLLTGSEDPEPPRAKAPSGLSVPGLPGRGTGGEESTSPTARPSATATPQPSGSPTSQAPKPTPSASASTGKASVPAATLRMGDKGPQVRALQELLLGQGFTYVSVSGVYDGQTKRGVTQLQRDRDIKGDPPGIYGPATQAALG
ncbi:peptidoglycan-binding protein [Streptomyces sp. NBC_01351]|uniref:peptidoglycan-binding domain-containing protein n=1 Tax=Streptomyces sp. NBC_01351 TaxID=2903833 RepID=UPI002E30CF83|nr:peptidoglycan-binding protein [Streptomyces sp. NBC_01351]